SRVPSADGEENPLDRHRHSDVLLNATQPLSNTLVTRRVQQVASSNTTTQLEGIGKVLQDLRGDPSYRRAGEYIDAGLLTHLRNCLRIHDSTEIRLPTVKIISNFVTGPPELTDSVVGSGCAPYLLPLVTSPDPALAEEAVWALVNMAGDSSEVRELVLRAGIMPHMLKIITSDNWTREDVTPALAQKLTLNGASSSQRFSTPHPAPVKRPSNPRVLTQRSSSIPSMSTPLSPCDVEVRQTSRGGSVTNLIVPAVQLPRTAGPKPRRKDEDC
ncbi:importin subunit alpha-like, partial [Hyalella azteca]|uniref:Importin subunit alpha-like n=1 Tax=Hyalella azteca TaxID=294128 RepID=A0A979FNX4_HYAAZ